MHRITNLFALTMLSVIASPAGMFAYSSSDPNMNGERRFMNGESNNYDQMQTQNYNMQSRDNQMMWRGYDPNQSYPSNAPNNNPPPHPQAAGQMQMMRGENPTNYNSNSYNQNGYNSNVAMEDPRQPAPVNSMSPGRSNPNGMSNGTHPVYEYVLGPDNQWHMVSQNHPSGPSQGQDQSRTRPSENPTSWMSADDNWPNGPQSPTTPSPMTAWLDDKNPGTTAKPDPSSPEPAQRKPDNGSSQMFYDTPEPSKTGQQPIADDSDESGYAKRKQRREARRSSDDESSSPSIPSTSPSSGTTTGTTSKSSSLSVQRSTSTQS